MKQPPVERWIINPMKRFLNNSTMSGIVLFSSALVAMILANSPWSEAFNQIWETKFVIGFGDFQINKSLHYWINDGLMAMFFFVVGLELKREIIAGELSEPKNAILPLAAAVGGMVVPALIYFFFNSSGPTADGWGIPMATDIAFVLGVVYLLGDRVPISLKIFLTALAIVDDIGAVLVIAFFYTSDIYFESLFVGAIFLALLIGGNLAGVRSSLFYGIVGISGLWLAFLMSGVHATIAAVLAAFTIPARVKISANYYTERLEHLLYKFKEAEDTKGPTVTEEQFNILGNVRDISKAALTPLQRLEHGMHPLVAFIVMPIFALSNAGVTITDDFATQASSPIAIGVFAGLMLGKVIGVVGIPYLILKLKWTALPRGMNMLHLWGAGFLTAIGFTMSLFITGLAFTDADYVLQAKLGILAASILASFIGYFIIRKAGNQAIND